MPKFLLMLRFDMMEIMLSRLEDEPTNQSQFEVTRFGAFQARRKIR